MKKIKMAFEFLLDVLYGPSLSAALVSLWFVAWVVKPPILVLVGLCIPFAVGSIAFFRMERRRVQAERERRAEERAERAAERIQNLADRLEIARMRGAARVERPS